MSFDFGIWFTAFLKSAFGSPFPSEDRVCACMFRKPSLLKHEGRFLLVNIPAETHSFSSFHQENSSLQEVCDIKDKNVRCSPHFPHFHRVSFLFLHSLLWKWMFWFCWLPCSLYLSSYHLGKYICANPSLKLKRLQPTWMCCMTELLGSFLLHLQFYFTVFCLQTLESYFLDCSSFKDSSVLKNKIKKTKMLFIFWMNSGAGKCDLHKLSSCKTLGEPIDRKCSCVFFLQACCGGQVTVNTYTTQG